MSFGERGNTRRPRVSYAVQSLLRSCRDKRTAYSAPSAARHGAKVSRPVRQTFAAAQPSVSILPLKRWRPKEERYRKSSVPVVPLGGNFSYLIEKEIEKILNDLAKVPQLIK